MKRYTVWTVLFVAILSVSLAAVAKDKDKEERAGYTCSPAKVAGSWGYSETGTVNVPSPNPWSLPAGTYPYASVGSYTLYPDGTLSGARTASLAGNILKATIEGTATVNSDCTGTETLYFTDPLGNVTGPATKFLVYVDKAREARKILTNPGSGVLVTEAKKQSQGHANGQFKDEEDED